MVGTLAAPRATICAASAEDRAPRELTVARARPPPPAPRFPGHAGGCARAGLPRAPPAWRTLSPPPRGAWPAISGATMSIITPVPCSNPATLVTRGSTCTCQWYGPAWRCGAVWNTRL